MVLDHVAQCARRVVIARAMLDADAFGCRNLDVVDIAPIPQGLKHRICQAKDQQVLHGFFTEVVVDPVNLVLFENSVQRVVEVARRFVVAPERLLDNNARPSLAVDLFAVEARCAELLDNGQIDLWGHGAIETAIPARASFVIEHLQTLAQCRISLRIVGFAAHVID